MALRAEAEWISPHQLEWIARLEREKSNLREAMEFCLSQPGEAEAGLRIATSLFPFWLSRGTLTEGRHWLDRLLVGQSGPPTAERVKALYVDSVLAEVQGDLSAGTDLVEEGSALAEDLVDPVTRAHIANADGLLALYSGNVSRACIKLEEALEVFRAQNDLSEQVWNLVMLGVAYTLQEETARAIVCHEEVLAITNPTTNRYISRTRCGPWVLRCCARVIPVGRLDCSNRRCG